MSDLSLKERVKDFLRTRQQAYQLLFSPESVHAKRVLKDLAKFCRANETTFHSNPEVAKVLEGRREVWLRIQNHLKMDPDQLWEITNGRKDE